MTLDFNKKKFSNARMFYEDALKSYTDEEASESDIISMVLLMAIPNLDNKTRLNLVKIVLASMDQAVFEIMDELENGPLPIDAVSHVESMKREEALKAVDTAMKNTISKKLAAVAGPGGPSVVVPFRRRNDNSSPNNR